MKFQEMTLPARDLKEPAPKSIRDAPTPPGAAPAATQSAGDRASVRRQYIDEGRTSRLAAIVAATGWTVAIKAPLPANVRPLNLLATADRVVIHADDRYVLFSAAGAPLATGMLGGGEVILEPAAGLVVLPDTKGALAAHSLADGRRAFTVRAAFGDTHARPYLAFASRRLITTGRKVLRPIENPKLARPRPQVLVQMQELGEPIEIANGHATVKVERTVYRPSDKLLAAVQGTTLVVATEDRIYHMTLGLDVKAVLTGGFEPLAMSLDEARRIYLVASAGGKNWLWVLSLEGERLLARELPAPRSGGYTPPIVGYGHAIFVPVEHRILVIDPRGEHRADYQVSEAFAGAVITPDDTLLVSDGADLVRFNPAGESQVLAQFPGESLRTAPIAVGPDRLWVATDRHLYGLVPATGE
jgi:hypothetical protein